MRVDAFMNNMFGGMKDAAAAAFGAGTAVEDEVEDLVAQVAVEERIRVEVTLGRPVGLVLEPLENGKGAIVMELVVGPAR